MGTRPASILFVTWDGAGNLPPERALVRALLARGHTVRAVAHDSVRETLERDGVECLPLRGARHYDSKEGMPPHEEMPFVLEHIWYARAFGSSLLAASEQVRPDLLLLDICLTSALVAARRVGLPMGRDQPLIAARVAQLGLGSVLGADAPVADIRHAITTLLADAGMKRRATEFARDLVGHPGLEFAADRVEQLLAPVP